MSLVKVEGLVWVRAQTMKRRDEIHPRASQRLRGQCDACQAAVVVRLNVLDWRRTTCGKRSGDRRRNGTGGMEGRMNGGCKSEDGMRW